MRAVRPNPLTLMSTYLQRYWYY